MRARMLFVSVGLLSSVGGVPAQLPPPKPPIVVPVPPTLAEPVPLPASVPREKSTDDLLAEIEQLRVQKAELEKKEQELTAALRKKLDAQAERLKKLGVNPKDAEPERVGRITVAGKQEEHALKMLELQPGQLLSAAALTEARKRLEQAGFVGVTVEAVPSAPDSKFKDVHVKVNDYGVPFPPLPPKTGPNS